MTKYTINKVFEKALASNIWKIEVDPMQPLIAVETRDMDSTEATFQVFDLEGNCRMSPCQADGKEWTLDSIQDGHLILKRVGEHTPIQEGIQIIDSSLNKTVFTSYEFILLDVFFRKVHARHRSIASGETIAIDILTGQYSPSPDNKFEICPNKIQYPITYQTKPHFLASEEIEGPIWLSKCATHYLWCYHQANADGYSLILALSDLNRLLDRQVILSQMGKMIPQPYFQMDRQLFFMTFDKREIVSYLV